MSADIYSMPNEILLKIASELSPSDLTSLARTSKRFTDIAMCLLYQNFHADEPEDFPLWADMHPTCVKYDMTLIPGEDSFFKYAGYVRWIWLNASTEALARCAKDFEPPYELASIRNFRCAIHAKGYTVLTNYLKPFENVKALALLFFHELDWDQMHITLTNILTFMPRLKNLTLRSEYWTRGEKAKNALLWRNWPENMPEREDSTVAQIVSLRIILMDSRTPISSGFFIHGNTKDSTYYPARFFTLLGIFNKALSTVKRLEIDNPAAYQDYLRLSMRIETPLSFPQLEYVTFQMTDGGDLPPLPVQRDCLRRVKKVWILGSKMCKVTPKKILPYLNAYPEVEQIRFLDVQLNFYWRPRRRNSWLRKIIDLFLHKPTLKSIHLHVTNVSGDDDEAKFEIELETLSSAKIFIIDPPYWVCNPGEGCDIKMLNENGDIQFMDDGFPVWYTVLPGVERLSGKITIGHLITFQVITLGAGGGPSEEGCTGFLVRSTATDWTPASVLAVDAGSHLASIIKILDKTSCGQHPTTPTTPNSSKRRAPSLTNRDLSLNTTPQPPPSHFGGANLPFKTPRANAAHIFRELVGGYCITHPHLDHVSGLVINTAGLLPHNAKKIIAGLPPTIEALKTHIFNDIIWPNLTDENGGVGFLTYQRLVDASVVDGKIEYRKLVDGLSVQAWPVSHGHCMHNHTHRGSDAAMVADEDFLTTRGDKSLPVGLRSATGLVKRQTWQKKCVYDSSCFFIRDDYTEKEILIFGDVEPDSVSISEPRRNVYIWNYAAEKMHRGLLSAIFIESSYDIHQKDEYLYGHMTPKHVVEELKVLASKVLLHREREARRFSMPLKKRKTNELLSARDSIMQIDPFDTTYLTSLSAYNSDNESDVPRSPTDVEGLSSSTRRRSSNGKRRRSEEAGLVGNGMEYTSVPTSISSATSPIAVTNGIGAVDTSFPLKGLTVVIIHVKDDFDDDKDVRQSILHNLQKLEEKAKLGCTFKMAEDGGSMFF
ncbi:hypothetical protein H072_2226 [Dactylellina haptotyla CBS 200.50]|uniref:F-box domain-containing protein n=1 Tax=Dactylellina haptotyla (strain CBS 200.50) TaxID=1284197 RepID=S8AS10_DACHA|nr:hypothetical protein H072_2226 [Dactylellina haptotyla CBS 200.50]